MKISTGNEHTPNAVVDKIFSKRDADGDENN